MTTHEKTSKRNSSDGPTFVLLDYNGTIGTNPSSGRKVAHRMSPLQAAKPEAGVMSLVLQPGFNRRPAKTWSAYTDVPGIARLVGSQIKVITDVTALDEQRLAEMIERSYDHESLKWLRGELEAATQVDGENRTALLYAIDAQLRKRAVNVQSVPFVKPASFVPQPTQSI